MYGSLNDFLPPQHRQIAWPHVVEGRPTVKDLIERLGVPHPEIDLILVNGVSVPFDYAVQSAGRIAIFPRFTIVDIGTLTRVRPRGLGAVPTLAPFTRCLRCNTELREVPKASVESRLEPRTRKYYQRFHECPGCHRIYWAGSHWQRLTRLVERTRLEAGTRDS